MNVGDVMTSEVRTCSPRDSLHRAAQLMWEGDCGSIPVLDQDGRVIAMITDRDICMAAYTQGRPLVDMLVSSAASHDLVAIRAHESLDAAEALMARHKVRRLPVIDANGRLAGILSMNDLAVRAYPRKRGWDGLSAEGIANALAAVCEPRALQASAAE